MKNKETLVKKDITERNVNKAKYFEYLEKFRINKLEIEDICEFIRMTLNSNPYFELDDKRKVGVNFCNLPENNWANYDNFSQQINISNSLLNNIIEGKMNLNDLFNVIGHEFRHHLQKSLKEDEINKIKDEKTKNYLLDIIKDRGDKISKEEILFNLTIGKSYFEDDIYQRFDKLNDIEKKEFVDNLIHSHYLKKKNEEDARKGGEFFAAGMFENIITDEMADKYLKEYINDQSKDDKWIKTNKESKEEYKLYEEYLKSLENISLDNLEDIQKDLKSFDEGINEYLANGETNDNTLKESLALSFKLSSFLNECCKNYCNKLNSEDVIKLTLNTIENGKNNIFDGIISYQTESFNSNESKEFSNSIYKFLVEHKEVDYKVFSFYDILNQKQLSKLVNKLMKDDWGNALFLLSGGIKQGTDEKDAWAFKKRYSILIPKVNEILEKLELNNTKDLKEDFDKAKALLLNFINELNIYEIEKEYSNNKDEKSIKTLKFNLKDIQELYDLMEGYEHLFNKENTTSVPFKMIENNSKTDYPLTLQ